MGAMRILGGAVALLVALVAAPAAHAGGWVPSEDARGGDRTAATSPHLAVGRDGTAVEVWRRSADGLLMAAVRRPGQGWGTAGPVSATVPVVGGSGTSSVAVDAQGGATVAWIGGSLVHAVRLAPGAASWGAVQDVSAGDATGVDVAVGGQGSAIVTWAATDSTIQAALRVPGATTFAPATTISAIGGLSIGGPSGAMDDAGDAAVIWQRRYDPGGGPRWVEESAVRPVLGTWSARSMSSTVDGGASSLTYDIAITPDGRRTTAMWDYAAGAAGSQPVTYVADRSGATFATAVWAGAVPQTASTTLSYTPRFAIDDAGGATAAWVGPSGGTLTGARRPALGALNPSPLASNVTTDAVAMAPSGDGLVVWSIGGSLSRIVAARAPAGGTAFEIPHEVASADAAGPTPGSVTTPLAGADDQANLYVGYFATAGTDRTLAVAIYDAAAPALGALAIGGEATAGKAMSFSTSASDRIDAAPAIRWDFGDGAAGNGASASHVYAAAGTYAVKVTATDDAGNASSATRTIAVAAAPGGGGPIKGGPPVIVEPPKPPRVSARAGARFKHLRGGRTGFAKLTLSGLKKGDGVKLACSGGGCSTLGRKARKVTARKGSLDLLPYVKRLKLAPKAKLTITVSRKAYTSVKITYTMVKGKDPKRALA
jgi:hypothetical protein